MPAMIPKDDEMRKIAENALKSGPPKDDGSTSNNGVIDGFEQGPEFEMQGRRNFYRKADGTGPFKDGTGPRCS